MAFKKFPYLAVLCLFTIFAACSPDDSDHAGVITETESGKTIAGIVTDVDGKVLPNVEINLLQRNHVAARMAPVRKTFTNEKGAFEIENIKNGDFAIQMNDKANSMSAYTTLSISEESPDSSINLSKTSLDENASLEISLSEFSLEEGDTICLTGTINCAAVDSKAISRGKVTINEIPATEFDNASLLRGKKSVQKKKVDWEFKAGRTLYIRQIDSTKISGNYTFKIPDEVIKSLDKISAPHTLDSMIVSVKIPASHKNPSLVDDMGAVINLSAIEDEGDSIRYIAVLPKVDTTSFEFSILENETEKTLPSILIENGVLNTNAIIQNSNTYTQVQDLSLGFSFWLEMDKNSFEDTRVLVAGPFNEDIEFSIVQCEAESEMLCTTLFSHADSNTNDTIFTQQVKTLDGIRHHYSFAITDMHLTFAIDGEIIRDNDIEIDDDTDINLPTSFFSFNNLNIGPFNFEDLTIYILPNTIRHNNDKEWERLRAWMYAFYYIAEHEDSSSR